MTKQAGRQQVYDHRLRDLVRRTRDLSLATGRGVPRSTAAGWLRRELRPVVTVDVLDRPEADLCAEVVRLRRRVRTLSAVVGALEDEQLVAKREDLGLELRARPQQRSNRSQKSGEGGRARHRRHVDPARRKHQSFQWRREFGRHGATATPPHRAALAAIPDLRMTARGASNRSLRPRATQITPLQPSTYRVLLAGRTPADG